MRNCDSASSLFYQFLTRAGAERRRIRRTPPTRPGVAAAWSSKKPPPPRRRRSRPASMILIMESSRFVIEKKKTLLSLSTQRPRSRERRPRRATAARADTTARDRAGLENVAAQAGRVAHAFDALPETTNQMSVSCTPSHRREGGAYVGDKGSYTRRAPTSGGATCPPVFCPRSSSG